jgi:hypothetical protein
MGRGQINETIDVDFAQTLIMDNIKIKDKD